MKFFNAIFLGISLATFSTLPLSADPAERWVQVWNKEEGREIKLRAEDLLLKSTSEGQLSGLIACGFKQTDGTYLLGRLVWKETSFSPLQGFGEILNEFGFSEMTDDERVEAFLSLLQNSYGKLGTRPYTGPPGRESRPQPITQVRGPDDSHRFQVWFYVQPVSAEGGEWREVLYFVSRDGRQVKARTLASYNPEGERLPDFPAISEELFE